MSPETKPVLVILPMRPPLLWIAYADPVMVPLLLIVPMVPPL